MDQSHIYQRIIESIQDDILSGKLKPGSRLPAMRKMTKEWDCTVGTITRAYQELAQRGLVTSHVGQGTKVVDSLPRQNRAPLRRASLFNRAEAFLLELITAGYTADEVEQSVWSALDHWRTFSVKPPETQPGLLRFAGSHDPSLALIAAHYHEANPQFNIQLSITGSLGGLIDLVEKRADIAGCHLWDENTDTYNEPFVRKIMPGQKVALFTLAHRHVGLILPHGNLQGIRELADLTRTSVRFVNRQAGSGTRVWLDNQLRRAGISPSRINGYQDEKMTHYEVARAISRGQANVGLGVETAALVFGLAFVLLTTERYDLIIPAEKWELDSVRALRKWLETDQAKAEINHLGGYETTQTGAVNWIP